MKQIFFMMLIASALTIFGLSSCKKDNFSSSTPSDTSSNPLSSTTINLTAGHWDKNANGIYVCNFRGVIPSANINSNRTVKIYLVERNKETLINNSIPYLGGELWAVNTETDVKIIFHCYAQDLPFDYLTVKVVVE
jgi:hypothetical protein